MPNITKSVQFMIKIAKDDTHGYDQVNRKGPDYDCSSLVAASLIAGGFNVSPDSWTGNLASQLIKCGFKDCVKPWKAGDIHLNTLHHVCMSVDANNIAQASINEKGTVSGGISGDQTGKEILICPYYEYSRGWDRHLRYEGATSNPSNKKSLYNIATYVISGKYGNGSTRLNALKEAGYDANVVQEIVNILLKNKGIELIAIQTISGKYGNGNDRKKALKNIGYDYDTVQKVVNSMLKYV